MDQYIGKMLDNRYEILECIGMGGMAVVYKTRDHRLNRLVAVKILKPELAQDAEFRRRFHDESQAVAMLSHANIVSVYDVSRSDGLDYIVMELVDGLTLKLLSGTETLSQVELPPPGGGEGGTTDHRLLTGRNAGDQHPVEAITGLGEALEAIPRPMTADELRKILSGGTRYANNQHQRIP